jgi:hypothetical protein
MASEIPRKFALSKSSVAAVVEILANFLFPYLIYVKAEASIGQVHALMAASVPPILWSAIEFARKRRVDAISILVIAGIALSLLAFLGGGSVRFLQLRENLVTGLIGFVFLGSAIIRRPLIYQLARAGARRKSTSASERLERLQGNQRFRQTMTMMTLVWGFGLLAQTIAACALVFSMPIRDYLIVGPVVSYGAMALLAAWTFWFGQRQKKRGEMERRTSEIS